MGLPSFSTGKRALRRLPILPNGSSRSDRKPVARQNPQLEGRRFCPVIALLAAALAKPSTALSGLTLLRVSERSRGPTGD
jgi:hypothetical protein